MNSSDDRKYMELAVAEARRQVERYGKTDTIASADPFVGCVVVTLDGRVESGYRGELDGPTDHAEFTVITKKLAGVDLRGATVYTTLEPCQNRSPEKIPCANRLVEAGVRRVVIGYMDPDERGRGYQKLLEGGIEIGLFDPDLTEQILQINYRFIESRKASSQTRPWFHEIESACQRRVRILADLKTAPHMRSMGKFDFPDALLPEYRRRRHENDKDHDGWREQIAEFRRLRQSGEVLEYEEYDYIQWLTLRDAGLRPRAVYAGAVLVSPDDACIYAHQRSLTVATEPGKRHGFLGAFIVRRHNDADVTLLDACLRELHEESSAQPNLDNSRVVVVENLDIGWIDVMFMAGVVLPGRADRLRGSAEGEVIRVNLDQLEQELVENRDGWVSNGLAHHLIWLKLQAPGAPAWFRQRSLDIYARVCERLV